MTSENKMAVVRIALAAVAVINAGFAMLGMPQLAIDQSMVEVVYEGASMVLLIGSTAWAAWKNNSFTPEAVTADAVMQLMREGMGLLEAVYALTYGQADAADEEQE